MSMKEDRAREGKKARYRKMGFGPMMDKGEIDFGDKHPLTKKRLKNFKKKDDAPMSDERFYQQRKAQINKAGVSTKKMLTGGQAKIAAKAPPPNKIDAKDFAVLRAEKAKGRGMGLQDEKVQPGKVMKAKMGVATDYKKYLKGLKKATDSVKKDKDNKFIIRRMKLMGMPKLSKGGGSDMGGKRDFDKITERTKTYALAASMKDKDRLTDRDIDMATGQEKLQNTVKQAKKFVRRLKATTRDSAKVQTKMGGGMMKKYSKGGGFDAGTPGKVRDVMSQIKVKSKNFNANKLTKRDLQALKESKKGKLRKIITSDKYMGGGMMQKPMGYTKGTMVKARGCKLGRTKPTKIT